MSLLAARYARLANRPSVKTPATSAVVTDAKTTEPQAEPSALPLEAPKSPTIASRARTGMVRWEDGRPFEHYCEVCGAWGSFGFGVDLMKNHPGRWYCLAHKPER